MADVSGGLARDLSGDRNMCERAQVRVRAGRGRGLTWELGSEKSTTRSGHKSGEKSSPVKGGRGLLGAARPRPARTLPLLLFLLDLGGEGGSSPSPRRASQQPWTAPQSRFRRAGRRRARRGSSGPRRPGTEL